MNKITMAALATMATMLVGAGTALAGSGDDEAPVFAPMCDEETPCEDGKTCIWGSCYDPQACDDAADCWSGWCSSDGVCAEPPTCSEASDCGADNVCYGGSCYPADLFCSQDSDCGEGEICQYGMCEDRGRSCLSDADCGELAHCVFDNYTTVETGTASANATDPADGASGGGSASSGGGSAGADGDTDTETDPNGAVPVPDGQSEERPAYPYVERGECRIDVEAVTEIADCRAMCEAAAACATTSGGAVPEPASPRTDTAEPQSGGASDSGASDAMPACGEAYPGGPDGAPDTGCMDPDGDDPDGDEPDTSYQEEMLARFVEMCTVACSYGVALESDYAADVSAASTCLASLDTCEEMESSCEPEIDAIEEMLENVNDRVDLDLGSSASETGSTVGTNDPRASDDGAQELAGSPAADNSSCSGSGGGAPLGLALLAALMLLVVRRRTA